MRILLGSMKPKFTPLCNSLRWVTDTTRAQQPTLTSSHRMQAPRLIGPVHCQPVGGKHALPEVVPGELLEHAFTSGRPIAPNQIRTIVQKLNSAGEGVHVVGR